MPGLNASFTLTNISLQKECIQCPAGMPGPVGLPGFVKLNASRGLPGDVGVCVFENIFWISLTLNFIKDRQAQSDK
ncbi:unnamed protein product [Meloidogyne enterolobii]|uniref:Uncharacterized protein n=1 Tax=Meloidogyne enterolobii TaxID=390850 RepID=A0ACB0YKW5_MELEN